MITSQPLSKRLALIAVAAGAVGGAPGMALARSDSLAGGICERIMGLAPGEKHYAACVESLSDTQSGVRRGAGFADARRECLARGLPAGSSALAGCELDMGRSAQPAAVAVDAPIFPGSARSYFLVSRAVAARRDERACAALGLEPAGTPFADCVARLRGALSRASEPAM